MYVFLLLLLYFLGLSVNHAFAISPLSRVGGSVVDKGVMQIETRFGFSNDHHNNRLDNRFRSRFHIDYGVNDAHAFRIVTAQNKFSGQSLSHSFVRLEHRFQMIEARTHGLDAGFRLSYTHRSNSNSPNMLRGRFAAEKAFGTQNAWHWRSNILLDHDIGPKAQDDIELELRHQIGYKMPITKSHIKSIDLTFSLFNDFGKLNDDSGFDDENHQIGPLIGIQMPHNIYTEFGYRTGLSTATADNSFFLSLGSKF